MLDAITNIDTLISTKPSIYAWLIFIAKCNVLLQCVLLMLILLIVGITWTTVIWFFCPSTSFLLLVNLINPSKYSNSLGIMRMVFIRVMEIFPLMKCDGILDFITNSTPMFISLCSSSTIPSSCSTVGLEAIGNFLFGILTLKKTCWSSPQICFNFERVFSSSSTNTLRKFVVALCKLFPTPIFHML